MRRDHSCLRLSRLAKSWRCCVQVKRNKRHKTENIYSGRKQRVQWKRTAGETFSCGGTLQARYLSRLKKRNTFCFLEESAVVSTIVWLPGTLCTASNLDSCVFSSEPSTKNESIQTRWVVFFSLPGTFITHKVSVDEPAVSLLLVLPGMRAFCCEQMQRVFVFKFGGTASQLVISGGRHGVHLAEWHAGGCAFLPASFVRSRWLIYRVGRRFASFKCHILYHFWWSVCAHCATLCMALSHGQSELVVEVDVWCETFED